MALSALDEHLAAKWTDRVERAKRGRHGVANYRLIRYADDFAIMVSGTRPHAEAMLDEEAEVLSWLGLRLAMGKTRVVHIDEGLDFLGWRIQRQRKRGTSKHYVYTYPAHKAVRSCARKIKAICWQDVNLPLEALIARLNPQDIAARHPGKR